MENEHGLKREIIFNSPLKKCIQDSGYHTIICTCGWVYNIII